MNYPLPNSSKLSPTNLVGTIDGAICLWYHLKDSGVVGWRSERFGSVVNKHKCEPVCGLGLKECSLNCLGRGQKGRVSAVSGPNRCRLLELGFTSGTEVEVARRAAFGGPLEVRLRSYRLSLRCDEAESIQVETAS